MKEGHRREAANHPQERTQQRRRTPNVPESNDRKRNNPEGKPTAKTAVRARRGNEARNRSELPTETRPQERREKEGQEEEEILRRNSLEERSTVRRS